ncbi:hypothetical protein MalM25_25600 [Planctomycetes bacterium MalM25]|nr:hypothetical protein MalM25_25600 [Planctomycetes bacterium MalM25]
MAACLVVSAAGSLTQSARAFELPWWIDSIEVTSPSTPLGIGAVTLNGTWIDTGAPDAIGHSVRDGALHLSVSAPGLNVPTGDALTPWSLTEEFGPLDPFAGPGGVNEIFGSVWSVDPRDRSVRERVSGPDFLGWIIPPPRGSFEGLGTGQEYVSAAYDVSADGRVVSGANHLAPNVNGLITSEAFAWTPETGRTTIGLLPGGIPGGSRALGVSADGNYLAGVSTSGAEPSVPQEAFRWSLGGGMEGLGVINDFSSTSEARAISRNGAVVVGVDDFFPPLGAPGVFDFRRAFRYTDEAGMQDLGTLPQYGERSTSEAVDVSANGRVVVGTAFRDAQPDDPFFPIDLAQPFRWVPLDGMQGLGNLPRFFPAIFPTPQQMTLANAVSADGETVVGVDRVVTPAFVDSLDPYFQESAVLWTREAGWVDLGQLRLVPGPEQVAAEAVDVSGEGEIVVGQALVVATDAANDDYLDSEPDAFGRVKVPFIWDEERGMRPLARVLAGDFGLDLEGWRLGEVTAISDDGTTVVGTGRNPNGLQEAWRAVMHRNSRPGDADFDGDVDRHDHATLMEHLGLSSESHELYYADGDFDADGAVGEGDLALLLANYDGRHLGDFNADGVVDAADYTVWRDHQGLETGVADSNGDGRASGDDLAAWRANYGRELNATGLALAVPEPAGLLLVVLGLMSQAGRGSRRNR